MEERFVTTKKVWFHAVWISALIWFSIIIFMKLELASSSSLFYFLGAVIESVGGYFLLIIMTIGQLNQYIRYGFSIQNYTKGWFGLAVMIAFMERILTMYMSYFQQKFGFGYQIGSNQVTGIELHFDRFFMTGVIAPIFEEFLFRVLMFAIFAWGISFVFTTLRLNKLLNCHIQWFDVYNLKSKVCWIVILISSTIFSLMHGPDVTSFHFYALGGLVGAILFLKFGYWAAVVQHFAYNYLTYLFFISMEVIRNLF